MSYLIPHANMDATKFIELLVGECVEMTEQDHDWRKCPRCLALHEIQTHAPLAMKFLKKALVALRTTPRD